MEGVVIGAGKEARTPDIYLGKVVLYQLSYSRIMMVPQVRIELTTYRLQGECSTSELQGHIG